MVRVQREKSSGEGKPETRKIKEMLGKVPWRVSGKKYLCFQFTPLTLMFLIESALPWAKAAHHASTLTGMGELGFFTEE